MKLSKQKYFISLVATLVFGLVGGYCIGYSLTHKEVENIEYNYKHYRDKYLQECEIYNEIINLACNQNIDDHSKLYYIRSTIFQGNRMEEIKKAIKQKKSIERNKKEEK